MGFTIRRSKLLKKEENENKTLKNMQTTDKKHG